MRTAVLTLALGISVVGPACSGTGTDTSNPGGESDTDTDTDADVDSDFDDLSLETSESFVDIWAGGTDVYTVGSGTQVCHYSGEEWRIPGGADGQSCWERSDFEEAFAATLPDGIDEGAVLKAIWGQGDGAAPNLVVAGEGGYILEFNGTAWTGAQDIGTANIEAIDGDGPSNLIAVSWGGIYDNNDADWTDVDVLSGNPRFNDVWYDGSVAATAGEEGYLGSFGGASWSLTQDNSYRTLHGIDGTAQTNVWAVGELGAVLVFDGSGWEQNDAPTASSLWDVLVVSEDEVYVVGSNDAAFKWDGEAWIELNTNTNKNLLAITQSDDGTIYVSGNRGGLFRLKDSGE